ncbi:hypothetical protein Bca101_068129 [Brassica carinata]
MLCWFKNKRFEREPREFRERERSPSRLRAAPAFDALSTSGLRFLPFSRFSFASDNVPSPPRDARGLLSLRFSDPRSGRVVRFLSFWSHGELSQEGGRCPRSAFRVGFGRSNFPLSALYSSEDENHVVVALSPSFLCSYANLLEEPWWICHLNPSFSFRTH